MLRSPPPTNHLLCVNCGRDTSDPSSVPNDISASATSATTNGDGPPVGYHPFVNGDDMDSDEEDQEGGVMQDEAVAQADANGQTERIVFL